MPLNVLFMGDIVGKPGRKAIVDHLPALKADLNIDFVIANAENAAHGFGITEGVAQELYRTGIDVITLGNHTFDQPETENLLVSDWRMLRPYNYPPHTAGVGYKAYPLPNGKQMGVVSLMGRLFMEHNLDCPFQASRKLMQDVRVGEGLDYLIVDVHAEAASEKRCLAALWDGKASAVVGSHTHVPTADTCIMDRGTGYHTDAGMCGYYNSSLGMGFDGALGRFEKKGKIKLEVAEGQGTLCATFLTLGDNGLCTAIKPIRVGGTVIPEAR